MDQAEIGRQLRARRSAAGRTVASVAADAGLSVPYIANLENGRGNPTTAALTRLAEALGMRLVVSLVPGEEGRQAGASASPEIPASLVRLGRTARFREAVRVIAATLDLDADAFSGGSWPRWPYSRTAWAAISPRRIGGAFSTLSC